MKKPNCYECKHRNGVPGSAHSACGHPSFKSVSDDPMLGIMAIFASVGRAPPVNATAEGVTVKGNPIGIKRGWFNHPFNFDPTWLEECSGFEGKTANEDNP